MISSPNFSLIYFSLLCIFLSIKNKPASKHNNAQKQTYKLLLLKNLFVYPFITIVHSQQFQSHLLFVHKSDGHSNHLEGV